MLSIGHGASECRKCVSLAPSGDAVVESRLPGAEHPVRLGGDGTPTVADFAPAELGCVLRLVQPAQIYLVKATGIHPLGNTEFAQTIWHATSPPQQLAS